MEKLEEDRDDGEEEDADLGFDSLSSMMMESKNSFFSAMSSRSSKGPAAHRLRRMKKDGSGRSVSNESPALRSGRWHWQREVLRVSFCCLTVNYTGCKLRTLIKYDGKTGF